MKKYKLKIKDAEAKWNDYGLGIDHSAGTVFMWLVNSEFFNLYYDFEERGATAFTEEDIKVLPYGFVQQHDLIEFEEKLYNIICPYTLNKLVYNTIEHKNMWVNTNRCDEFLKDVFNMDELEENYSKYIDIIREA